MKIITIVLKIITIVLKIITIVLKIVTIVLKIITIVLKIITIVLKITSVKDINYSVYNTLACLSLSPDSPPRPHQRKLLWRCPRTSPWSVWWMPTSSFEGRTSAVGVEPRPTASAWSATASCARSAVGSTPRSPPRRPPRPLPKGS